MQPHLLHTYITCKCAVTAGFECELHGAAQVALAVATAGKHACTGFRDAHCNGGSPCQDPASIFNNGGTHIHHGGISSLGIGWRGWRVVSFC